MKKILLTVLGLSFVSLVGCVTTGPQDKDKKEEAPVTPSLTLDKMDGINLREVNVGNVVSYFGEPHIKGLVPNNSKQELYVYLNDENPQSTRLAMTFDAKTKKLVLAKWFVLEKETESDFSSVQSRYAKDKLDLKKPLSIKDEIFGFPANLYRSPVSPLQVAVHKGSKKVGALAWFMPAKKN